MSEETKVEKHPPTVATATVENRDASGEIVSRQKLKVEAQSEFGNTPQGMIANIWAKLGMLAAVVIAFFGMMSWFAYTVNAQVEAAREEAREVRKAAEQERKDSIDRYIASRTANDQRHRELLTKLDKVALTMEHLLEWYFKERLKAPGDRMPPPKMNP